MDKPVVVAVPLCRLSMGENKEGDIWIKESGYGRAGLETGVEFRLVKAN